MRRLQGTTSGLLRLVAVLLPVGLLIAAVIGPIAGHFSARILAPYGGADAVMQAGILEWTGRHSTDPQRWLDVPIFFPARRALTFMDSLLGQAWLVMPVRWLTAGSPALLYNLALIGSLGLAAAAFAWLWRTTGGGWLSTGFGALALIGSPYTTSQLGHLNQLPPAPALASLAALLLGLQRLLAGRARAGWLWWLWGSLLVVQAAWGWYGLVYALMAGTLVLGWGAWSCLRAGLLAQLLRHLAGPALLAAGGILWLAWPYLQTARQYEDFQRSQQEVRAFSADLVHLGNRGAYRAGWADWRGHGPSEGLRVASHPRQVLHPGWVALGAALLGLGGRRRLGGRQRHAGLVLLAIGALGLLLAFGDSMQQPGGEGRWLLPLGWLQEWLNPLRALRAAWRFSFLTVLAVSWWAAAGVEVIPRLVGSTWGRGLLSAGLLLLLWIESLPARLPVVDLAAPATGAGAWSGLPTGAVLTLPAPPDEAGEDRLEALWWHRMLMHGHPVTGGVSGWVPPQTRGLRRQLVACQQGLSKPGDLLAQLAAEGVRYVELAATADSVTVGYWQNVLAGLGYRGRPAGDGYRLFVPATSGDVRLGAAPADQPRPH
jgi:hypothetical protein